MQERAASGVSRREILPQCEISPRVHREWLVVTLLRNPRSLGGFEKSALAGEGNFCDEWRMLTRIFLAVCLFASIAFAEETYAIRFVRPMKAGDKFDVSAKVAYEDEVSTTFDADPIEDEKTIVACRLTGELTIVAVTSKGLPTALRLKLKTVDCVEDGKPAEFFKIGDVLGLKREEPDNVAEVNGEAAEDIQAQVIESLLSVEKEGEVTDDDIFGTAEKVKVGAEWPVNQKAAVEDMVRNGVKGLKPAGVTGTATLVRTSKFGDKPSLLLRMEAKIDGKAVELSSLPPDVKATRFHSEYTEEVDLPVDAADTGGRSKGLAKMEVDASGKAERGGLQVTIGMKIRRRVASEVSAIQSK